MQKPYKCMQKPSKCMRSIRGSAISEMPPAMFLLLFFAFFPLVNLIFLGVVYTSCVALNTAELREAAKTPRSQIKAVMAMLQESWHSNSLGRIAGITQIPESKVYYTNIGEDAYVGVSTTFILKPFLRIPFFDNIPALGKNWSVSLSSKRVLENPNYAFQ